MPQPFYPELFYDDLQSAFAHLHEKFPVSELVYDLEHLALLQVKTAMNEALENVRLQREKGGEKTPIQSTDLHSLKLFLQQRSHILAKLPECYYTEDRFSKANRLCFLLAALMEKISLFRCFLFYTERLPQEFANVATYPVYFYCKRKTRIKLYFFDGNKSFVSITPRQDFDLSELESIFQKDWRNAGMATVAELRKVAQYTGHLPKSCQLLRLPKAATDYMPSELTPLLHGQPAFACHDDNLFYVDERGHGFVILKDAPQELSSLFLFNGNNRSATIEDLLVIEHHSGRTIFSENRFQLLMPERCFIHQASIDYWDPEAQLREIVTDDNNGFIALHHCLQQIKRWGQPLRHTLCGDTETEPRLLSERENIAVINHSQEANYCFQTGSALHRFKQPNFSTTEIISLFQEFLSFCVEGYHLSEKTRYEDAYHRQYHPEMFGFPQGDHYKEGVHCTHATEQLPVTLEALKEWLAALDKDELQKLLVTKTIPLMLFNWPSNPEKLLLSRHFKDYIVGHYQKSLYYLNGTKVQILKRTSGNKAVYDRFLEICQQCKQHRRANAFEVADLLELLGQDALPKAQNIDGIFQQLFGLAPVNLLLCTDNNAIENAPAQQFSGEKTVFVISPEKIVLWTRKREAKRQYTYVQEEVSFGIDFLARQNRQHGTIYVGRSSGGAMIYQILRANNSIYEGQLPNLDKECPPPPCFLVHTDHPLTSAPQSIHYDKKNYKQFFLYILHNNHLVLVDEKGIITEKTLPYGRLQGIFPEKKNHYIRASQDLIDAIVQASQCIPPWPLPPLHKLERFKAIIFAQLEQDGHKRELCKIRNNLIWKWLCQEITPGQIQQLNVLQALKWHQFLPTNQPPKDLSLWLLCEDLKEIIRINENKKQISPLLCSSTAQALKNAATEKLLQIMDKSAENIFVQSLANASYDDRPCPHAPLILMQLILPFIKTGDELEQLLNLIDYYAPEPYANMILKQVDRNILLDVNFTKRLVPTELIKQLISGAFLTANTLKECMFALQFRANEINELRVVETLNALCQDRPGLMKFLRYKAPVTVIARGLQLINPPYTQIFTTMGSYALLFSAIDSVLHPFFFDDCSMLLQKELNPIPTLLGILRLLSLENQKKFLAKFPYTEIINQCFAENIPFKDLALINENSAYFSDLIANDSRFNKRIRVQDINELCGLMQLQDNFNREQKLNSLLGGKLIFSFIHSGDDLARLCAFFSGRPILYDILSKYSGKRSLFLADNTLNNWFKNDRKNFLALFDYCKEVTGALNILKKLSCAHQFLDKNLTPVEDEKDTALDKNY